MESGWRKEQILCAYIPVKEMLANAPGFRSLYQAREVMFEEIYADIIDRAYLPLKKGPADIHRSSLLRILEGAVEGKVLIKGETFFLRNSQGQLEFTLLAEGLRKLGLLWLLINNGTLLNGSVLFWDEPEANLNPQLTVEVVKVLIELQRQGVQVIVATHDYVTLKELDLQRKPQDKLAFHSFYRESKAEGVLVASSPDYQGLPKNAILDTYNGLYQRQVERALCPKP